MLQKPLQKLLLAALVSLPLAHTAHSSDAPRICDQMSRIHEINGKHLWLPQREDFFTDKAANMFANERTVLLFRGTETYSVPRNIDWSADPFDHSTWRLFFNSLGWIYAPLFSYARGDDEQAGIDAKDALLSWVNAHIGDIPDRRAIEWNDQAAAYRLVNFIEFERLLNDLLTAEEKQLLRRAIDQHVDYLKGLFSHPAYYGNNHGFMDAMAVYSAGVDLDNESWIGAGRRRINQLFGEMFVEGVSIEQSFGYQTYKLRLMHEADCFAILNGHEPIDSFARVTREALEFISLVAYPDLTLPAVGDTYYRMPMASLRRYLNDNTVTPVTRFIWSDGKSGRTPPLVSVRPHGGYGVFWPSRDTRLVFDFTAAAKGHNHNDGLNFTLFSQGEELIVDSAGPYAYGSKERDAYFKASIGHNVILVNDEDHSGAAELVGHGEEPFPWMQGETVLGDVRHIRTISLAGDSTVDIRDNIISERRNTYALLFHLPPHATVEIGGRTEVSVGGASFSITAVRNGRTVVPTTEQGWVTRYTNEREPAPFLRFEFEDSSTTVQTRIDIHR